MSNSGRARCNRYNISTVSIFAFFFSLQALAALSRLLINPDFVAKLKAAETPEQVQATFDAAEKAKEAEEKAEAHSEAEEKSKDTNRRYRSQD
jgi:hypothetical protein